MSGLTNRVSQILRDRDDLLDKVQQLQDEIQQKDSLIRVTFSRENEWISLFLQFSFDERVFPRERKMRLRSAIKMFERPLEMNFFVRFFVRSGRVLEKRFLQTNFSRRISNLFCWWQSASGRLSDFFARSSWIHEISLWQINYSNRLVRLCFFFQWRVKQQMNPSNFEIEFESRLFNFSNRENRFSRIFSLCWQTTQKNERILRTASIF